jgi:hypothetical protein
MFKLLGSGEILSFSLDQEKPVRSQTLWRFYLATRCLSACRK